LIVFAHFTNQVAVNLAHIWDRCTEKHSKHKKYKTDKKNVFWQVLWAACSQVYCEANQVNLQEPS